MSSITAIILTRNEEEYIGDCIRSIQNIVERIVVIDSYSEDNTVKLAVALGAEVYQHEFINHAKQYMYAVDVAQVKTTWIFKIDADERLTKASSAELKRLCNQNEDTDVNGIILRFYQIFMGKKLRHGGAYPWRKLSVYKTGKGFIEDRNMDEHIVLKEGRTIKAKKDSEHQAFKGLTFFTHKFNWYSTKEAIDYFERKETTVNNVSFKTWLKMKVYYKLPMGMRAWLYYMYRYYLRLGFLDGKEGQIYAFLHAYWYRYLVDAKIYEYKKLGKEIKGIGALK
jgi:glycosyltransferase involved in cell wall biosynthesis